MSVFFLFFFGCQWFQTGITVDGGQGMFDFGFEFAASSRRSATAGTVMLTGHRLQFCTPIVQAQFD